MKPYLAARTDEQEVTLEQEIRVTKTEIGREAERKTDPRGLKRDPQSDSRWRRTIAATEVTAERSECSQAARHLCGLPTRDVSGLASVEKRTEAMGGYAVGCH
ncbi:hypothetical protein NDU88_004402 [Pleurodeles waltl]|uniref:Uncharacterized protein n=1 Tax=Pleurodeles waltl TaxID=8319 RepID=A0AAV7TSC5_PLEWA|nr:hypothetical protein NDU88_004402 [Pleurodeles waltl]